MHVLGEPTDKTEAHDGQKCAQNPAGGGGEGDAAVPSPSLKGGKRNT